MRRKRSTNYFLKIRSVIIAIGGAVGLAFLFYFGIIDNIFTAKYRLMDGAMLPGLKPGTTIRIDKFFWSKRKIPVWRGEIYVVSPNIVGRQFVARRIIGLPGEHLQIKSKKVYVNGIKIIEAWRTITTKKSAPSIIQSLDHLDPIQIPAGMYFVMADNREGAFDSRNFGLISRSQIVGRVVW